MSSHYKMNLNIEEKGKNGYSKKDPKTGEYKEVKVFSAYQIYSEMFAQTDDGTIIFKEGQEDFSKEVAWYTWMHTFGLTILQGRVCQNLDINQGTAMHIVGLTVGGDSRNIIFAYRTDRPGDDRDAIDKIALSSDEKTGNDVFLFYSDKEPEAMVFSYLDDNNERKYIHVTSFENPLSPAYREMMEKELSLAK